MKNLALLAALLVPALALAEDAPAAADAKAEAPAELVDKAFVPNAAELPGVKALEKKAAAAAPGAAKPAPTAESFKPVGASAPYQAVLDGYAEAHKGFDEWLREASTQAKDLADREAALKKDIASKEAEITKLKLEDSKESRKQMRELNQENDALWADLKKLNRDKAALKKAFSRSAAAKVKELNAAVNTRLDEARSAE